MVAVLSELPNFEMNKKWEDVINRLVALKQNHELDYGEDYILKHKSYLVTSDDIFKNDVIPIFERDFLGLGPEYKNEIVDYIKGVLSAVRMEHDLDNSGDFYNEIGEWYTSIINDVSYLYDPKEVANWSQKEEIAIATAYRKQMLAWSLFINKWTSYSDIPLDKFLKWMSDTTVKNLETQRKRDKLTKLTEWSLGDGTI